MTVHSQDIEYRADGRTMIGELSFDAAVEGARPGVLVCHEGTGLSDHAKNAARRLAELGFVAFALDYFGEGKELPPADAMKRLGELSGDVQRTRHIGRAGLDVLVTSERCDTAKIATIGYCFGGTMALELARAGTPLASVVGFHSRLATPEPGDARNITAKVLVNIGANDPWIRADERAAFEQEMTAGGVDWQMNLHGGAMHSFTNPAADGSVHPAIAYHEAADRRSWESMLGMFDETIR
jgi:dienelactone hydrolase